MFSNIVHQHLQQLQNQKINAWLNSKARNSQSSKEIDPSYKVIWSLNLRLRTDNHCRKTVIFFLGWKFQWNTNENCATPSKHFQSQHPTHRNGIQLSIWLFTPQSFFDGFNNISSLSALQPRKTFSKRQWMQLILEIG